MQQYAVHITSLRSQILRYLMVGCIVFFVDLGTFILLITVTGPIIYVFNNISGKIMAGIVGFFLHKHFTFGWKQRSTVGKQSIYYAALLVFNTSLSTLLLYIAVEVCGFPTTGSKIATDILIICTAFVVSRHMIFRWILPPPNEVRQR